MKRNKLKWITYMEAGKKLHELTGNYYHEIRQSGNSCDIVIRDKETDNILVSLYVNGIRKAKQYCQDYEAI